MLSCQVVNGGAGTRQNTDPTEDKPELRRARVGTTHNS
jgi:hypothetical protein